MYGSMVVTVTIMVIFGTLIWNIGLLFWSWHPLLGVLFVSSAIHTATRFLLALRERFR